MSRVTLVVNRHQAVSETFQRTLARTLAEGGHQVTVHALRAGPRPELPAGIRASQGLPPLGARSLGSVLGGAVRDRDRHLVEAARRARRRFGATARAARAALVAAPILATDPEVLHLGFSGIGVALADVLDLVPDARLVVSCRGTDELVRPLLDAERADALGALLRRVDLVHVVADAVGAAVVALGADPAAVRVIRPAVDLDAWPERPARPTAGPHLVVAVARLQANKGVEDLVAALAVVREQGVDARLAVVGDGPRLDDLRLRIARTGLAGHVDLLGARDPAGVRQAVAGADVFASASLSEGISNGVLEAMATGVAVVSTAVGGMAEVLTDGVDGWLVPPGRPDRLAAALVAVLGDEPRRTAVAHRGRARVEAAFGLDRQRREWLAAYAEPILAGDRASSRFGAGEEGR